MKILQTLLKPFKAGSKPEDRLSYFLWFSIFWVISSVSPFADRKFSFWIYLFFILFPALIYVFGKQYIRIAITALILAVTIILTFGLVGQQHTAVGKVTASGGGHVYLELTGAVVNSGDNTLSAKLSEPDSIQFSEGDEVLVTYRELSVFGFFDLGIVIDSLDTTPAIDAGSRNITISQAWLPLSAGALPFILLVAILIFRRFRSGSKPSVNSDVSTGQRKRVFSEFASSEQ